MSVQNQILSVSPIILKISNRPVDLEIRVTAPISGESLPIILFSHGGGNSNFLSSYKGGSPLSDYWASQGFVVIQPTHLSSKTLKLDAETPGYPIFAESRVEDMKVIIDHLDYIENTVPTLKGRMNHKNIAVAGHSGGGLTAAMLLGASYTNDNGNEVYLPDNRIKTAILLAVSGEGDKEMPAPWGKVDIVNSFRYTKMNAPALVITGDKDISPISSRGAEYYTDAYFRSPGEKTLLTLFDGEHMLGGVTGYDAQETTDENPERVALIQEMTTAYLHSIFNSENKNWEEAVKKLETTENPLGKVESKS
jgi:dienelactone hydrolase